MIVYRFRFTKLKVKKEEKKHRDVSMHSWDNIYVLKTRRRTTSYAFLFFFRFFLLLFSYSYQRVQFLKNKDRKKFSHIGPKILYTGFFFFKKMFGVAFIGVTAIFLYLYMQIVSDIINFTRVVFIWFAVSMFLYLLISGFIFFLKRYNYSKFTTSISRFWKRSFNIFWLLEGFLFLFFFYTTLNSSNEVVYFFDYQSLFKDNLYSFRYFFFKLIVITALITLSYLLLLVSRFMRKSSIYIYLILITSLLLYIFWLEFLQFYHFTSFFDFFYTSYDDELQEWSVENEFNQARVVQNYVLICVIAKFWHFVLILLMWFFSLNRIIESSDAGVYLMSANLQNFLIMYLLNFIFFYSWLKFFFRKYMFISFNNFYECWRERGVNYFFTGFMNVFFALFNF